MKNNSKMLQEIADNYDDIMTYNRIMEKALSQLGWKKNTNGKIPEGKIEVIGQGSYYEGDYQEGYLKDISSDGKGMFYSRFDDLYIKFWRKVK